MSLNLDKSVWKRVVLGDVAEASKEKCDPDKGEVERYVAGEHMDTDDLTIRRWGEVGDGYLGPAFHRRFRPGQVLYGSRRTYLRKVAVAEFDGVCANTTFAIQPKAEGDLLSTFLPFVLTAEPFHAFAIAESKGSVNPYVNWSDIARYEFDLPPVDEQERVANLLWAIENHRRRVVSCMKMVGVSFSALFCSWWTSLPSRPIGSIGECITGSTPPKSKPEFWDSRNVAFYTPSEIQGDTMHDARQMVSFAGAEKGRMIPRNSVAVACIGGDLGRSAVVEQPGITNQQITSVIGLDEKDAYLLQALLADPVGRAAMEARETTTIVRKLNKTDLMRVEIPWPNDRSEMRRAVASRRTAFNSLRAEVSSITTTRRALLEELFGGVT